MSAVLAIASPRRIKASHRRRRRIASGQSVQRYYDPQIGRFLSVDPANAEFNRYNYAGNNPYRFVDPDGRAPKYALDQLGGGHEQFSGNGSRIGSGFQSALSGPVDEVEADSYWDSFDEQAAQTLAPIATSFDEARYYWDEQGGASGAVFGTISGIFDSNNIGNTIRQTTVGFAAGGLGRGANWAFQARGGSHVFFSGSDDAVGLALGAERMGTGATIYMTRAGSLLGRDSMFWKPVSFMFAATTNRATAFLGSYSDDVKSIWNTIERPVLELMRIPTTKNIVP